MKKAFLAALSMSGVSISRAENPIDVCEEGADLSAFANGLIKCSVKEVEELARILKEEYGIEAANTPVVSPAFKVFPPQPVCHVPKKNRIGKNKFFLRQKKF